ncbi:MAG: FG-GAP repeat domain-containing protein [Planctomycetota bacterium]|jgi:hypothetical protein
MYGNQLDCRTAFGFSFALVFSFLMASSLIMLLPGCGIGGALVMGMAIGGSDSDKPVGLRQNSIPVVYVNTPARQVGDVTITYRITDLDSENCSTTVLYGLDSAEPASSATLSAASPPTTDLASSPTGVDHTFIWDSATDLNNGLFKDVRITVVANDGTDNSLIQTTDYFLVGNDPPDITIQTPAGEQSGDVAIFYTLTDSTSDPVSIEIEFRENDASPWAPALAVTGTITSNLTTDNSSGITHAFVWNSLDNTGGVGSAVSDFCKVQILASDGFDNNGWVGSDYFTIHNNFPPSATIIEIGTPGVFAYRGVLPIKYRLYDSESDDIDVSLEWSHDGTVWLPMGEYPAGCGSIEFSDGKYGLFSTPVGVEHSFLWNSLIDTEEDYSFIRIRVVPSDPFQQGIAQEILFNSMLQNHRFGVMESDKGSSDYSAYVIGDFDNNGYGDVVMRDDSSADIEVATGGPNIFTAENAPIPSNSAWTFIVGNFCNNDGVDDLAMVGEAPSQYLHVIEGINGTGLNPADVRTYVTGTYIQGITSGDFDNDGITDIAAAGSGFVYVFDGTPGGYPAASYSLAVSGVPFKNIAAADMNGNGIDDLLAVSDGGTVACIWPGKNGSPINNTEMIPYYTPGYDTMDRIVTSDFNGDGEKDFAVSHESIERISYWLGQLGSLPDNQSGSYFTAGPMGVTDFYAFDMNLDGADDMLFTTTMWMTPFGETGPYDYHIVPGSPAGPDFAAEIIFYGERFNAVVFEDMIGSGRPQMVYSSSPANFVQMLYLIQTTNGLFNGPETHEHINDYSFTGAEGDVTGDGLCDMGATTPDGVSASFLVDTCGFPHDSGIDRPGGKWQYIIGTADFDGDGVNEFVLRAIEDGYAYVYKGTAGSAPTVEPISILNVEGSASRVCTGDLSGDGIADAAIPRSTLSSNEVAVFLGEAGTGLSDNRSTLLPMGGPPTGAVLGDFDNNGILEVVAEIETAFLSPDTRYFPGPIDVSYNGSDFRKLYGILGGSPGVGDFNGDGIDDLVYKGERFGDDFGLCLGSHGVGLLNSNVTLRTPISWASDFIVADYNCDGCDDVVLLCGTQMQLFLGNTANGLESTAAETFATPSTISRADTGDINGDGYPDFVVSLSGQGISVYLNQDGNGITPAEVTQHNYGNSGGRIEIADINGDGIEDIICGYSTGTLRYLPGTPGTGPRQNALGTLDNPGSASALQTSDLNADGLADVIISSSTAVGRLFLSHTGRQTYAFTLDNAGGTFRHPNQDGKHLTGFELNVPAGAVVNKIDVVVLHPSARELPAPPATYWRPISKPLLIIRETLALAQNASLTIPISPAVKKADWTGENLSEVHVLRYERETGSWTTGDWASFILDETEKTVTISIERFGYYIVALKP